MKKDNRKKRGAGKPAGQSRIKSSHPSSPSKENASEAAQQVVASARQLYGTAHELDRQADALHASADAAHQAAHSLHEAATPLPPGGESGAIVVDDKRAGGGEPFPIVGIGASAGGYEAFAEFLRQLPADTGMGFVLILHLDPKHKSQVTELLSRSSRIPVLRASNDMEVKPDHLFVIPENSNMTIIDGKLRLHPRKEHETPPMPIDLFFRSLAQDKQTSAIGVVLSGTGCDGTLGIEAIKGEGGLTFAQDDLSSKFHDMPGSAIASGSVDFILPPTDIASELCRLARHPLVGQVRTAQASGAEPAELERMLRESPNDINTLFRLLRGRTGVDFTLYKQSTLKRRIIRRMILHKKDSLAQYTRMAESSAVELDALFNDLLINVTSFFRDPNTFKVLRKKVFPRILKTHSDDAPWRFWVCGCSTGEEAYSLAISLIEFLEQTHTHHSAQIFATDVSDLAIEKARAGIYPPNILQDVSPERLRRFFGKVNGSFQVNKSIRDMCVFARQNVLVDPPFSNLDMVSCRNVLIYFGPVLQRKVVPLFHYALRTTGFLLLGNSETIGASTEHFALLDKKHKIYTKKANFLRPGFELPAKAPDLEPPRPYSAVEPTLPSNKPLDIQQQIDRLLLRDFAPPTVVINSQMDVIYFRGRTSLYLEHAPGTASLNLFKMLRENLSVSVRAAISKASRLDAAVKHSGIEFRRNGHVFELTIEVVPFRMEGIDERFFAVLFREGASPVVSAHPEGKETPTSNVGRLRRELARVKLDLTATKESMQSVIEEQEATNEELKSANEEIQSSNEELQSTNEELETAKEELQSTNEELTTLNEELQNRNTELSQANNDLQNLLASVNIPILMVSSDLTIRRLTPLAERVFDIIPTDIGRRFPDLRRSLLPADLDVSVRRVIDDLAVIEREVQDRDGHWYLMRIRPYRTRENKIEGAVITLMDVDELRKATDVLMGMVHQPLLMLDGELRIRNANPAFLNEFAIDPSRTMGKLFYEISADAWNQPQLRSLLEEVLPRNKFIRDLIVEANFPRTGMRQFRLNATRFFEEGKGIPLILLAFEEIKG
ncbi:MAG: CheR family methyltransferase [Verrucomicrobiota bacterium]